MSPVQLNLFTGAFMMLGMFGAVFLYLALLHLTWRKPNMCMLWLAATGVMWGVAYRLVVYLVDQCHGG